MVSIVCVLHEPITVQGRQVGSFLRKDDSWDRTLVIYIVLFIYAYTACFINSWALFT